MVTPLPPLSTLIPFSIHENGNEISAISLGAARLSRTRRQTSRRLAREMREYLAGKRRHFSRFPLATGGLSAFTWKVLTVTSRIPYGATCTYSDIARKVAAPGAARAVGTALGKNPFPLLIPCHRVVAKNGKLGGFSSGVGIKKKLLALEGVGDRV